MIVAMPCLSLAHSLTHLLPFFCDLIDVTLGREDAKSKLGTKSHFCQKSHLAVHKNSHRSLVQI